MGRGQPQKGMEAGPGWLSLCLPASLKEEQEEAWPRTYLYLRKHSSQTKVLLCRGGAGRVASRVDHGGMGPS